MLIWLARLWLECHSQQNHGNYFKLMSVSLRMRRIFLALVVSGVLAGFMILPVHLAAVGPPVSREKPPHPPTPTPRPTATPTPKPTPTPRGH